jgi:GNAT superfamily N-acetyltransferase
MANIVTADGPILEPILDGTYPIWHEGLSRAAYGRYNAAQLATAWGRDHLVRSALVGSGGRADVLASAKRYMFDATLDGEPVRVVGLGAVFTQPAHRGHGHARELIDRLLEQAAADGADLAVLFSEIGPAYYARLGFEPLVTNNLTVRITESDRHGAPATMIRGGEERDLAAIVAMGQVRAARYRFHLNRSRDVVHYAIAKKRLLAGFGPAGARMVHFFIAEEGASAAAYVVVSVRSDETGDAAAAPLWTIEEAGDRDPTGARVGAILQALIARDPIERRPAITAWLPHGFLPPQLTVVHEEPSGDVMMIRVLTDRARAAARLTASDIFYWHGDLF